MQQLLGKPLYTEDIVRDDARSETAAKPARQCHRRDYRHLEGEKVAGVVDVFTWEDVPNERFSNAGQTYPETRPLRPPHHRSSRFAS